MTKLDVDENDDLDNDLLDDDELDDEDDAPAPTVVRRAPPVAKAPPRVRVEPNPADDVTDAEFDVESKKRKDQQTVADFLERKRDEETISVEEITDLLLSGDTDKITSELHHYCDSNLGIKKAKQLLREARDRAKARITRISGVVSVLLDELKSENEGEY